MKLRLIPRDEKFFELFNQAAANMVKGAELLREMLDNYERRAEYQIRIEEAEHEGDITTHEIMDKLNKTFVTPIDHEDIRAIASRLDDVLDLIEATADRMLLYEAGPAGQEMVELVEILVKAAQETEKAVKGLGDLTKARRILDHCIEINRLENVGDECSRAALAKLFRTAEPVEALKWREIYEHVETAIDKCEDIADVVEGVVVKYS